MADTITFIQGSSTLDLDDGTAYEVKQVTNSIDPAVGDLLTPKRADHYALSEYWEVTFK